MLLVHVSFRRLWVSRQASGVPRCSDVYFQWRQSVPAQTAATATRPNLRRTAEWTPELRLRRRFQTPDWPSACSQRRRGRGCAYEKGGRDGRGRVHNTSPITREEAGGEKPQRQTESTTLELTPGWRPSCCRRTSCWGKSRWRWRRTPGRGSPPGRWRWATGPPAWTPARRSARRGSASIYPQGIWRRRAEMDVIDLKETREPLPHFCFIFMKLEASMETFDLNINIRIRGNTSSYLTAL